MGTGSTAHYTHKAGLSSTDVDERHRFQTREGRPCAWSSKCQASTSGLHLFPRPLKPVQRFIVQPAGLIMIWTFFGFACVWQVDFGGFLFKRTLAPARKDFGFRQE